MHDFRAIRCRHRQRQLGGPQVVHLALQVQRNAKLGAVRPKVGLINADGSVDLYFGPTASAGKEKNWVKTSPGMAWFALLRAYGPLKPYFDRSWVLPDNEKMK
jgi:hypothetical protein